MNFRSDEPIGLQIKKQASGLGVSLMEITRRSGVNRNTIERMKNEDSLTIKNLKNIQKAIDSIVTEKTLPLVTKIQDNDGNCYWIPNTHIGKFEYDNLQLSYKNYVNCPEQFDEFKSNFSDFLTVDPNQIPNFLLKKPICIH